MCTARKPEKAEDGRDPGIFLVDADASVAAAFLARKEDILTSYEAMLREWACTLVLDRVSWQECRDQAESVIADCAAALRQRRVMLDESALALASEIGFTRASRSVHPIESLRAGAALFEAILSTVNEVLRDHPDAMALLNAALRTLNNNMATRIQAASICYDAFLFNRIKETQVTYRRRLARELHDRVGTIISLAVRQLEMYDILRDRDEPRAESKVAAARHVLVEALDSTRQVVADLRPSSSPTNLREALQTFVESIDVADTAVQVVVNGDEQRIPELFHGELFMVIRESLRNVFSHARAKRVVVRVDVAPHEVRACVEDEGIGFDVDAGRAKGGHGLSSMRERTELLGGQLMISNGRPRGTRVEVLIPFPGYSRDDTH